MAAKEKSDLKVLEVIAKKLLELVGSSAKIEIDEDAENESFTVNLKTEEEAGLLIGNRGRTLDAFQTILGLMLMKKTGNWKRVLVNVADWREKETARLEELAQTTAERAKETGEEQPLYNLSSSQRRIIHMALSEDEAIATESRGEGKERYLVVAPKR